VLIEKLRAAGVKVDAPTVEPNPIHLLPAKNCYEPDMRVAELHGLSYAEDAKLIAKVSYNIGADTSLLLYGVTQGADYMQSALTAEKKNPMLSRHFVRLALSLAIDSQLVTPLIAIKYPGRAIRQPRGPERNLDGPSAATVSKRTRIVRSWKEQPRLRVASKAMRRRTACRGAIELKLLDREFALISKR
jgi:hypothetical protein